MVSITQQAGQALMGRVGSEVWFEPESQVRAGIWKELQDLLVKANWPRHPKRFKKMYQEMKARVGDWPERLYALNAGYSKIAPLPAGDEL